MDCKETGAWLDAYADGELDLARTMTVEEHLRQCASCAVLHKTRNALGLAMKHPSIYFSAPSGLETRILAALPRGGAAAAARRRVATMPRQWFVIKALAAVLVLMLAGWWIMQTMATRTGRNLILAEVVSSHVRSLQAGHLTDVLSTDQHTVKPWFGGRLDYSPTVIDTRADGFPLIGGRLDYIAGRPVAAIVYQRARHDINLFNCPANQTDVSPEEFERNGYHAVHWSQAGMNYWAISDVNQAELEAFAKIIRERAK